MHDPQQQHPIVATKSIKKFRSWLQILVTLPKPTMFTVTGKSGIGKTSAIQYHMDNIPARSGRLSCISVVVPANATELSFMRECLLALGENPGRRNANDCAKRIISLLKDPTIKLLIIDESDRLNAKTFDRLRDVHDKTRCPVAVVGLPDIMRVISKYPQFRGRIALPLEFPEMTQDNITKEFLPQLVFSHWEFDPNNPKHIELSERLWKLTKPSLRDLVDLVQIANAWAAKKDECVSQKHVNKVIKQMKLKTKKNAQIIDGELNAMYGVDEAISDSRNMKDDDDDDDNDQ